MVRWSFFLLVFFLSFILNAQDYTFRVLTNKGDNQVKRAGSETLEKLKTGAFLFENDEIILSTGSYVSLEHSSGKTIDTRKAGVNKVNVLEKYLLIASTNPSSERKKYFYGLLTLTLIIGLLVWLIMIAKKSRYSD